uniref:Uncharacterized protein n=1 Tax=Arundo donax TaxID=35708 RepID=A0A0A8Z4K7_ARUDO
MAQQGCESCRKWQEHCYQEHMDVRRIRFFKLMTGDFAQGISLPERSQRADLQRIQPESTKRRNMACRYHQERR